MTVGRKFLLIAVASLVPLGLSMGLWLREIHTRLDQMESERAGLRAHREMRRVEGAMIEMREAALRAVLDRSRKPEAETAMMQVQKMLGEVEIPVTRGGQDSEAVKLLAGIRGSVEAVARNLPEGTVDDVLIDTGEGLSRVVLLMQQVTSRSGLVVDSDASTFYLSRIAIERIPTLLARLSEARATALIVVARGASTGTEPERLRASAVLCWADLQGIGAHARDLARVSPQVAERVNQSLPEMIGSGQQFLRSLESLAVAARQSSKDHQWVYEQDQTVAKALQTYDRLHFELVQLLEGRVGDLTYRRNVLVGVNLLVVGIAALFAFFLMRSVRKSITNALDVAHRVAGGDLSRGGEVRGKDETARLMQSLNDMTHGLARMVGEVRSSSETIGADVRHLVEGNRDLSARTEGQASAIEEAAASMEELTASVRQNRDTARETQRIAATANEATGRGIEAAGRVVENMESIRASTHRVGEIVGMIDSIAFQTNILALNAAVEAARAGEHGRGFAVVAAEVRGLAKRCADSAREIKGLVRGATQQVTDGAKLVDEVSEAIGDINARVAEVGQLMNHIVSASGEQSSGIEQVSQTITSMEHATQQNSALVEEIVAATESLSQQTARLSSLVGVFRLEQSGTGTRRSGAPESPRAKAAPQHAHAAAAPEKARVARRERKLALPER